jgi:hypothetical protein
MAFLQWPPRNPAAREAVAVYFRKFLRLVDGIVVLL